MELTHFLWREEACYGVVEGEEIHALSGEDWLIDPPSLMIFVSEKLDPSIFSTDPNPGSPYIMWAGTPYEHLMVPVAGRTMN